MIMRCCSLLLVILLSAPASAQVRQADDIETIRPLPGAGSEKGRPDLAAAAKIIVDRTNIFRLNSSAPGSERWSREVVLQK